MSARSSRRSVRRRLTRWYATALVATGSGLFFPPTPVAAQSWQGWNAYWENDSWVLVGGSDDAFTNGLRLALGRHPNANLPLADRLQEKWFPRQVSNDAGERIRRTRKANSAVVIGQNFFTPREITDYDVDPRDRPYAGLWYLGARIDITEDPELEPGTEDEDLLVRTPFQSQIQHSFELDVGVLGQGAGGRPVQSAVHAAISTHRIPKGWSNQIKNSPAVSLLYMIRQRFGWEFFDVVPHGGVTLGTTQTYPYAGLSLRLGWGLSGFPTLLGRNTSLFGVSRSAWEFGVTGGIEGRYFVRNSFVEGSLFRSAPGIDAVRGVGDYRLGLFLRVVDWRFDYMFVRRSAEVGERGPSERLYDNYGSLQLSYEPGSANDEVSYFFDDLFEKVLEPAFRGFYLEAGIRSELGGGREPGIAKTHGMHVAVGRSVWGWFSDVDFGFEIMGVGREFGPPTVPGGDHRDRFLVTKLLTVRYRPGGGRFGPVDLHVRAGGGGSHDELEITPGEPGPRLDPCPAGTAAVTSADAKMFCGNTVSSKGVMVGAALSWRPIGDEVGLNLDYSWNRLGPEEERQFHALTLGFRWTPG